MLGGLAKFRLNGMTGRESRDYSDDACLMWKSIHILWNYIAKPQQTRSFYLLMYLYMYSKGKMSGTVDHREKVYTTHWAKRLMSLLLASMVIATCAHLYTLLLDQWGHAQRKAKYSIWMLLNSDISCIVSTQVAICVTSMYYPCMHVHKSLAYKHNH